MDPRVVSPVALPGVVSSGNNVRVSLQVVLPLLEARAFRLARSRADADDLVQETILRALRFEDTFQNGTNLRAWLLQILHSVFISRCRRRTRERRAMERFISDPNLSQDSYAAPMLSSVSDHMHSALHGLPEKFRSVIELVDLRDHSYREAAEVLNVPVGTVMSRLFRARRMLEVALGEENATHAAKAA
jgi:RNA polymerase sigma-70 factor (ECF subfamily)